MVVVVVGAGGGEGKGKKVFFKSAWDDAARELQEALSLFEAKESLGRRFTLLSSNSVCEARYFFV